jgi:hypothetical protein
MSQYEYVYGEGPRSVDYLNEMGRQGWKFLGDYALGLLFMREVSDEISYRRSLPAR